MSPEARVRGGSPGPAFGYAPRTESRFGRRGRVGDAAISVRWASTSPSDGRFSTAHLETTPDQLRGRFQELHARGEGYVEVATDDRRFPLLLMGFRGEHAVVHRSDGPESMSLLRGDGSVSSEDVVEVLIMDNLAAF